MASLRLGTCKVWSLLAGGLYIHVVFRAGLSIGAYIKNCGKHVIIFQSQ